VYMCIIITTQTLILIETIIAGLTEVYMDIYICIHRYNNNSNININRTSKSSNSRGIHTHIHIY